MAYTKDWFLNHLTLYTDYLYHIYGSYAKKVLQTTHVPPSPFDLQLEEYMKKDQINEGEDFIFKEASPRHPEYLGSILKFYKHFHGYSNEKLEGLGFSREEITQGLKDIALVYGYPFDIDPSK